jgi:HAD superfamily hydrolase (TIGR01509 family)
MKRALIFDLDGVLVDSMYFHATAWKTSFKEAGIEVDIRDIFEMEGANDRGIVERVLRKEKHVYSDDIFISVPARKHELFNVDNVKPFNGMEKFLREMHEQFHLALVSGSDRDAVEKMTDRFYSGVFDVIISGNDVIRGKPFPDPYLKAVEMLCIKKEECIVIENAPLGVEAAKNAGLFCVGLPTYVDAAHLEYADRILKDHAELQGYLRELYS